MKKKTILATVCLCLVVVATYFIVRSTANASVLTVTIYKERADLVIGLNGRKVSVAELRKHLSLIAQINTNIAVYIKVYPKVTVPEFLSIAKTIKTAGLRNIVIMCQGEYESRTGHFVFPMLMKTNAVGFCVYTETSDFVNDPPEEIERADDHKPKDIAEPSSGGDSSTRAGAGFEPPQK